MKDTNPALMKYRGYSALIRYSPDDECLIGHLIGIEDLVSFHGDSVKDMRRELKVSVDGYLEFCRETGRDPQKPYSGKLNLRLPKTMHRALALRAESSGRSINDLIVAAVDATLAMT